MWNGGNQLSGWCAYLSFFRHVARLGLDYSRWRHYETLAELTGPRVMHPQFCIVSERPEVLTVDAQARPHNDTGPFCRWADGTELYALHGVRVPASVVLTPAHDLDPRRLLRESNADVRREIYRKIGGERILAALGAKVLDAGLDDAGQSCEVLALDLGDGRVRPYIKLRHPGIGTYHVEGVPPDCRTVEQALRYRRGAKRLIWQA